MVWESGPRGDFGRMAREVVWDGGLEDDLGGGSGGCFGRWLWRWFGRLAWEMI